MAFQAEDQTDEDFFDKLVDDDDFGMDDSLSKVRDMDREVSNVSISEALVSSDDYGEVGLTAEAEDQRDLQLEASKNEVQAEGTASPAAKAGGGACKVKTVQWSAFNSDAPHLDSSGFGSYSDLLTEKPKVSADGFDAAADSIGSTDTFGGFLEQQADQFDNSSNGQAVDMHNSQYWENLYPGWKYDAGTGQWYEIGSVDSNASLHSESYNVEGVNIQDSSHANNEIASNGFVSSEVSGISYLHHTAKTVMETVNQEPATSSFANWSQTSPGVIEYPPDIMFDPQYPGWYYDTNTQQWHELESYAQSVGKIAGMAQDHLPQNKSVSDGLTSNASVGLYGGGEYVQNLSGQGSEALSVGTSSNIAHQNFLHSQGVDGNAVDFNGNQHISSIYGSTSPDQVQGFKPFEVAAHHGYGDSNVSNGFQSFIPSDSSSTNQLIQPKSQSLQSHLSHGYYEDKNRTSGMNLLNHLSQSYYGFQAQSKAVEDLQSHLSQSYHGHENMPMMKENLHTNLSHSYYVSKNANEHSQHALLAANAYPQFSHGLNEGRSSAGRPQHALVAFGFGGILVVLKDSSSLGTTLDYVSQDASKQVVSILHLSEVVGNQTGDSNIIGGGSSYFNALCQQSFPGPLVGANVATKDVYKCIDEKIKQCEYPLMDQRKGEPLKLLLSLLKISCQHYGKLRAPFGSDPSTEQTGGPESAVTKLFASARRSNIHTGEYDSCMRSLPSDVQVQRTAIEVQNLLVSGRRKEALQHAQDGQLWGPALVLAAQLGDKFYVDTVKQMAHKQLVSGSPLRTLSLLIAGQPADVFSDDYANNGLNSAMNVSHQSTQAPSCGMLHEWEENLAIITANRTKDDELVIVHLGDCLWKEREEVIAAHTCYMVAEANFESYSDSARLCLIGADHWKCPRTYASPHAIQMTEIYEYSKVLGNSQFILLPFQPYKIIYANMLAEVGRVSESLRYCQASQKLLKNSGRTPEVETWKFLFSSLEERLKTYQQGGFGTNLAPAKLVGKLFTSLDRSIHRMMGAPPAPLPPIPSSGVNDRDNNTVVPKVANSQSSMAISSLIPSASVGAMNEQTVNAGRNIMHNRSISEPDFGRSPKQDPSKNSGSSDVHGKAGTSRFGRFGASIMGWVSRPRSDRQAKLGGQNKFYYDENLKTWVEEGAGAPAQQVLPPPPTKAAAAAAAAPATTFQSGMSDYNINNAFRSQGHIPSSRAEAKSPGPPEHAVTPPIPPSNNQFSARAQMGVRSRYVDTFNKGLGASSSSFQSLPAASMKPMVASATTNFFIPTALAPSDEQPVDAGASIGHVSAIDGEPSSSSPQEASISTPPLEITPPPHSAHMPRFPSMDNITPYGNRGLSSTGSANGGSLSCTRAASWSGSYGEAFGAPETERKPPGGRGASAYFKPKDASSSGSTPAQSFGDELQEVEL